jgi:hypothetical protein
VAFAKEGVNALTLRADNGNTHGFLMKKSTFHTADLVLLIE